MNAQLSQKDLAYFDQKLSQRAEALRQEIGEARDRRDSERFTQLAGEAHDVGDDAIANLTVDTTSADIRRDREELREVDEAIGRVHAGSYGICMRCGKPIERARLEAYPAAARHVACQEAHEKENGITRQTPTL
jgi:DnaK suppressor protein